MDFNIIFEQQAKKQGSEILKTFADREIDLDCADVAMYSRKFASWMLDRGFSKGDKIVCWMGNVPEFAILMAACMRTGVILVPVSIYESVDYIQKICDECECNYIFWDSNNKYIKRQDTSRFIGIDVGEETVWGKCRLGFLSKVEDKGCLSCDLDKNDDLVILYTSGSTGKRKGIKKSVNAFFAEKTFAKYCRKNSYIEKKLFDVRYFNCCPWYHLAGMSILIKGLLAGYLYEITVERYQIKKMASYINKYRPTIWNGTATMLYRACVNATESIVKMPIAVFATGEPISQYIVKELEKYKDLSALVSIYGTTEAGGITLIAYRFSHVSFIARMAFFMAKKTKLIKKIYSREDFDGDLKGGILGELQDGVEILIYDDTLKCRVDEGETGEICTKTVGQMTGYSGEMDDEIYLDYEGERYIRTGDIGYMKNDLLYLSGRKKNMIIRSGENILPIEIEQEIECYPGVRAVIVFGVPDANYGEAVVACMEVEDDFDLDKLKVRLEQRLPKYMIPQYYYIIDEIPMNSSGKKDVRKVRETIHGKHLLLS